MKAVCVVLVVFLLSSPAIALVDRIHSLKSEGDIIRPNVIFIVLDATRADHCSCYGYKRHTTPHIDSISRKGALFLNHFSNETYTKASLPQYMTSRYITKHFYNYTSQWGLPIWDFQSFAEGDAEQTTLPEVFNRNNYKTLLSTDHDIILRKSDFGQLFDECLTYHVSPDSIDQNIAGLISWIQNNQKENFFIYCHVMSPHAPYNLVYNETREFLKELGVDEEEMMNAFTSDTDILGASSEARDGEATLKKWRRSTAALFYDLYSNRKRSRLKQGATITDLCFESKGKLGKGIQRRLELLNALYDGNLKYADKWIGMLYKTLQDLALADDTLFIITSDHGENLGEHNRLCHGGPPWDSVTKVPMVMVYPHGIQQNTIVKHLSEAVDIMPTILDICKISLDAGKKMDGVSLFSSLHDPHACKEFVLPSPNAIRTLQSKQLLNDDAFQNYSQFYNIIDDPKEQHNIYKQNIAVVDRLIALRENRLSRPYDRFNKANKTMSVKNSFCIFPSNSQVAGNEMPMYDPLKVWETILSDTNCNEQWVQQDGPDCVSEVCFFPSQDEPCGTLILARDDFPPGSYHVFVAIRTLSDIIQWPFEQDWFMFRIGKDGRFFTPLGMMRIDQVGDNAYYLDLGEVYLKESGFSMEIFLSPLDRHPCVLSHIKFVPEGGKSSMENKQERSEKNQALRSLGYL